MSFAKRHYIPTFNFTTPEDHQFLSIAEFAQDYGIHTPIYVRALYINTEGNYGDAAVLITDEVKLNLPKHLTKTVKDILSNPTSVNEINEGIVGFTVTTYENQYGEQYSIEWCSMETQLAREKKRN